MAKNNIKAQFNAIANEIKKDVRGIVEETVDEVSGDALLYIEGIGDYDNHRKTKNYRKNFYLKKTSSSLAAKAVLANKQYQLTHLLEKGHVIKNKQGTYGRTKAIPHWDETEEIAIEDFEKKLQERLGGR